MTETVGVVVGTFGDPSWERLAASRALPSVASQTVPCEVRAVHEKTLHEARNSGATDLNTDYLVFLDADDELDPGYVEAMLNGVGDIRQPSTVGVHPDGRVEEPHLIPPKHLLEGNYLVVGSMMRRSQFLEVGGFHDYPAWEDWELFIRLWLNGASISQCPEAVYRVYVGGGRNDLPRGKALKLYHQIRSIHLPKAKKLGLL